MEPQRSKCILEAALLSAVEPLTVNAMKKLFDDSLDSSGIEFLLTELASDWRGRSLELVQLDRGWRFQTCAAVKGYLEKMHPEKPARYSRATMEALAIIAYKQPVTRGDIEAIRGVTVSSQVIRTLEDRGWIESVGHKEAPGRPALWVTTGLFLQDLNLKDLSELPSLEGEFSHGLAEVVGGALSSEQSSLTQ